MISHSGASKSLSPFAQARSIFVIASIALGATGNLKGRKLYMEKNQSIMYDQLRAMEDELIQICEISEGGF